MQLQTALVRFIATLKAGLADGKKDDIMKIWDTVGLIGFDLYKTTSYVVSIAIFSSFIDVFASGTFICKRLSRLYRVVFFNLPPPQNSKCQPVSKF